MTYKIIGNLDVSTNISVNNKTAGVSINNTLADINGSMKLNIPTSSEIDNIFSQFPLSQYGSLNNNPVGAAGSFNGGSTVAYYSSMPSIIEDDGSLAYLRPGTSGNTVNYYYTYINTPESSTVPKTTISAYYDGTSKNILFYDSYTRNTLIYEDIDNHEIHVVLTYGTLKKQNHKEAIIPRSSIPYNILSAVQANDYVYIFTLYNPGFNYNNPISINNVKNYEFKFIVYKIAISEIESGTISNVITESNISGTTMYGDSYSANSINIADVWTSDVGSDVKSFQKYSPVLTNRNPTTYSIIGSGNACYYNNKIIFSFHCNSYATNSDIRSDTMFGFTVTYDPITKIASTDLSPTPITCTGATSGPISWNNPYNINASNLHGVGTGNSDGNLVSFFFTESGLQYAIKEKYVLSDSYIVTRCSIQNFTNIGDAYKIRSKKITLQSQSTTYNDFASRVGDQLAGGAPISNKSVIFAGTGTVDGVTYTKYNRGISDIGLSHDYTYKSLQRGTITGFSPQSHRVPFGDDNELTAWTRLSFCDINNNVKSYGSVFFEGEHLTAGFYLDPDTLKFDKTVSIDNNILLNLKQQILNDKSISSYTDAKIGLYYSPDESFTKSIAVVIVYLNSNDGGFVYFSTVDCEINGSNSIVSASLITTFTSSKQTSMRGISDAYSNIVIKSGLGCVKYSDFTYISISALYKYSVPGDTNELTLCGVVNNDGTISNISIANSYHVSDVATSAREYSYIPNLGFGYYVYANTDKSTKLIFNLCGNTLSDYNNNLINGNGSGTQLVILAQDIPEGFFIYFTEVTPLFIYGKFFEIPISTLDLNKIENNPGNKTYFLYVQMKLGKPVYVASTSEIPETYENMFIGTAQTDNTRVINIDVKKVSRLDVFRPSIDNIGHGFPVSSGLPMDDGSTNW